jgi:hypothetical protein
MINDTIKLPELVEKLKREYNDIAAVYIWHRMLLEKLNSTDGASVIHIRVYTGEANSAEDWRDDLVGADYVTVDIGEEDSVVIPFDIIATYFGADGRQQTFGTTVYMADNVIGGDPRNVETGLDIFREKLAGQCPTCKEPFEDPISLRGHNRSSRACVKRV